MCEPGAARPVCEPGAARAMPSPRTPRGPAMGATNQARPPHGAFLGSPPGTGARERPGTVGAAAPEGEPARRLAGAGPHSARVPRLSALDRVRETDGVPRAATSRASTARSKHDLLPHVGVSPRTAGSRRHLVRGGSAVRSAEARAACALRLRRPTRRRHAPSPGAGWLLTASCARRSRQTPMEPIRSAEVTVGPEYMPAAAGMRVQDIVPEYERSNPLWIKMEDTYGALSEHKHALLRAFQEKDRDGSGTLSKKEFSQGLREVDQSCKLSMPRVVLNDMVEEASNMFAPERNPSDPQDVVYYEDFVSSLQRPTPRPHQTMEDIFATCRPAARLAARTARFIERPRQGEFSLFERMKAHIIQNDLRTLLALRRGLDPGSGTRETFLCMDTDRDGVIGKEDLRQKLLDLGMPMRDENMELILSYCDTGNRGGIDYPAFVKSFEANGRGWFHPFNPHKRLPSPPFRPRADQTSPAYAKTPPSRKV